MTTLYIVLLLALCAFPIVRIFAMVGLAYLIIPMLTVKAVIWIVLAIAFGLAGGLLRGLMGPKP